MEDAPDLPWAKMAAAAGTLLVGYLTFRGAAAVLSMAVHEARDRLNSGRLPRRWG
jgi:hypothetical protein